MRDNIQLTHADHSHSCKKFPLSLIANDINSPLNVGGLFRLCDALGVEKLYLCGDTPCPPNPKISKTSRSTEKHVNYETQADADLLVTNLKATGSIIIALEITSSSIAINADAFKHLMSDKKSVCLILGSENSGINKSLLALSDVTVHIPMAGNNSSMNVISAANIACYEITNCY